MKSPTLTLQSLIPHLKSSIIFLFMTLFLTACTPPTTPAFPTSLPPAITKTALVLPPTWTPGPPTETPLPPTPRPTATSTPEPTLGPTLPPLPTAFPPVRIASASDHPFPAYSLIFLETGVLREWKPAGDVVDVVTLAGTTDRLDRVQLFDVSSGGALVAILRRNSSGQNEVVLYDRAAGAIRWTQSLEISPVTVLKISPDNLWVAYAGSDPVTQSGVVGVLRSESPDQVANLAECENSCAGLLWSSTTGRLIWSDEAGIWEVDPTLGPDQNPVQLAEPPIEMINSGGENVTGVYSLGALSPSGRFLLVFKGSTLETIPSILDTLTGRVGDLSGSFLYVDPGSSVAWLADDTLAVARAGLSAGEQPIIEIWQVSGGEDTFMLRAGSSVVGSSPAQAPFVLVRLGDGTVRFAMLDFSTPNYSQGNGLYSLIPGTDQLFKLNDLPFIRANQAIWTPDGTGVLLLTINKTYYVPTDGGLIYEMDDFLGPSACCFAWIP